MDKAQPPATCAPFGSAIARLCLLAWLCLPGCGEPRESAQASEAKPKQYVDVLTAEQSLLSAQIASVNDRLQQLQAVVTLYRALGGGWRETPASQH